MKYSVRVKIIYTAEDAVVNQEYFDLSEDELWSIYSDYNEEFEEQLDYYIDTTSYGWDTLAAVDGNFIYFSVKEIED